MASQQAPVAASSGQSSRAGVAAGTLLPHLRAISAGPSTAAATGLQTAGPAAAAGARELAVDPAEHPIVALGDSITYGYGTGVGPFGPPPDHSYPWDLQRALAIPVVNAGISGSTAHDVLDPSDSPGDPRPMDLRLPALLALQPRVIIVGFGSNEAIRGWPMSRAAADLDELLGRIADARVPIVLFGTHVDCLTMPCPDPAPGYSRQSYGWEWDVMLRRLASKYGAELVLDVERGFSRADLTDWIHPSATGYALLARRLEPAVRALLDSQSDRVSTGSDGAASGPGGGQAAPGGDRSGGGAAATGGAPSPPDPGSSPDPSRPTGLWRGEGSGSRQDGVIELRDLRLLSF